MSSPLARLINAACAYVPRKEAPFILLVCPTCGKTAKIEPPARMESVRRLAWFCPEHRNTQAAAI